MIDSIDSVKCNGCGICVDICIADTLRMHPETQKAYIAYPEDCVNCRLCQINCPSEAIVMNRFRRESPIVIE